MKEWLSRSVESRAYPFVVATPVEKVGWANAGAASEMASALDDSTASVEFIERMSRRGGWDVDGARSAHIAEMQPDNDNVKKGKFGEVLHGAILEQFCGMVVICHRYRYSPDPNISPPGMDIIALVPQGAGGSERAVYGETKLRTGADGNVLGKALGQLEKSQSDNDPPSLKSTLQALSDADPPLFDRVMQAAGDNAPDPHYRIGVIFEARYWSDIQLGRIKSSRVRRINLEVDIVKIESLGGLIEESYSKVGRSNA